MTQPLLVVGSVALDTIHTPTGSADKALGGSATYFSIAASHFQKPGLVAVVGTDFPKEHIALLEDHVTDLDGLEIAEGQTFQWGGRYHADMAGRDTLFTHLNVFEHFSPKLPSHYQKPTFLFLANIDPELQAKVLDSVERPEFVACDTMNFWIEGPKRPALLALLKRLDCIIINDEEAELLTGDNNPVRAGKKIMEMGPKTVLVKKGPHGAILFHGGELFHLPALPIETVEDPTGAGDTFAGGFMGYLAAKGTVNGETLRQAAVAGTLLASFCVQGFGVDRLRAVESTDLRTQMQALLAYTRYQPPEF